MLCGFGGYVWERLDLQRVPGDNRGHRQAGFAGAVRKKQKVIVASQTGRQVYTGKPDYKHQRYKHTWDICIKLADPETFW